jgi:DNA processing protein
VLPSGLDRPYPARNRDLFADTLGQGGALVSPYKDGTPPRKFNFVRRNSIIAGMADAVVVVEASFASGSLYTAQAARKYHRVVCAVPGSPGCESLIAQGAAVAECEADIFDALAGKPRKPNVELPCAGSDEAIVLQALGATPASGESLASATGLSSRMIVRALATLELDGLALPLPGRNYVRSTLAAQLVAEVAS